MLTGANGRWIAMEHYRLHSVERLPDSPYKRATLEAIHLSLARLIRDAHAPDCTICFNRGDALGVPVTFPTESKPRRPEPSSLKRIVA